MLGRLCAAYGLTMSRLMLMVEDDFAPLVPESAQPVWVDASAGFRRRSVSPPAAALAGEVLACELDAGARIEYPQPPRPNLEHHLLMLEGALHITVDGRRHAASGRLPALPAGRSQPFRTPRDSGAATAFIV